jgi:hypothetical protein
MMSTLCQTAILIARTDASSAFITVSSSHGLTPIIMVLLAIIASFFDI